MEELSTENNFPKKLSQRVKEFFIPKALIRIVIFITLLIVCFFTFNFLYNEWFFGTYKVGSYYINSYQSPLNKQFYFHFGKLNRDTALRDVCKEVNQTQSEKKTTDQDQTPIRVGNNETRTEVRLPHLSVRKPDGWVTPASSPEDESSDLNYYISRYLNGCYEESMTNTPTGLFNPSCSSEVDKLDPFGIENEIDGIISMSVYFADFCDYFKDVNPDKQALLAYRGCETFDKSKFVLYKDLFLSSFTWAETPACAPTLIMNTKAAEPINVAGFSGLKQEGTEICRYEGVGSLHTQYNYYIPISGDFDTNLMVIEVSFVKGNAEALTELNKFEKWLGSITLK
jgi:hypothetical protein